MRQLDIFLQILTGTAYLVGVGGFSLVSVLRNRRQGVTDWLGIGLIGMASTCGPHHLDIAYHLIKSPGFQPPVWDLLTIAIAAPWGALWLWLRFQNEVLKGSGEVHVNAAWPFYMLPLLFVEMTAVFMANFGLNGNYAQGAVQLSLVIFYCVIGYHLWRVQVVRRLSGLPWSMSGLALAMIFPTCAASHAVFGLAITSGRWSSDAHSFAIDTWGVFTAFFFLVVVRRLHLGSDVTPVRLARRKDDHLPPDEVAKSDFDRILLDDTVQHDLKHQALNDLTVCRGTLGLVADRIKSCSCGAFQDTMPLIEAALRKKES